MKVTKVARRLRGGKMKSPRASHFESYTFFFGIPQYSFLSEKLSTISIHFLTMSTLFLKTLNYFRELSALPRSSRKEEKVRNWLISWAT